MRFQRGKLRRDLSVIIALLIIVGQLSVYAYGATANNNRFNVAIVLDASGSMNDTDPNGYRYEAISQFSNLLAEQGNYLGGIAFSTDISVDQEPAPANSHEDKDRVIDSLSSVSASGWTNMGDALLAAVDELIEKGDPNLPSVIVFLSDGNTEMPTDDETAASLDSKADAIQKARENGIAIYSVCLNADNSADITEMEQISNATGGVFREVSSAEDLGEVFNAFYNLIYGTSTITLIDETFPQSGIVEKDFEVPGIGVEEVNIIIYGKTSSLALFNPNGQESDVSATQLNSLTMLKITDIVPGVWRIVTAGVPGDQIKINMVYNTDLSVNLEFAEDQDIIDTETPTTIKAFLLSGGQTASDSSQYEGYSAQLHVLDAYDEELTAIPMSVVDDHFEVSHVFDEGTYKFKATVTGNYIDKESNIIGPLRVVTAEKVEEEKESPNTPPYPVETPVKKTVYLWPFMDNSLSLDMAELAKDNEDDTLSYKVVSSSFLEGTDYSVDGDIIQLTHFSLSKGSFDIRAVDSGGLSCDIELIVVSHNVGIIALIAIGIAIVLVLAVIGFITYHELGLAFMGEIHAENLATRDEAVVAPKRGRFRLGAISIGSTGFDSKCYFQATGKKFIWFKSRKPVYTDTSTKPEKKIKLQSGFDMNIYPSAEAGDEQTGGINIRFDSYLDSGLY